MRITIAACTLFFAAATAWAHHSFAMFDMSKNVTFQGTILEYNWENPHTHIPLLQSLHLAGLTLLPGTTVILNIRLVSLGFRKLPLPLLTQELWPWTKAGLILSICTGIFRRTVRRDPQSRPRVRNAAIAAISLLLWFGVGWSVRAIAFFQ